MCILRKKRPATLSLCGWSRVLSTGLYHWYGASTIRTVRGTLVARHGNVRADVRARARPAVLAKHHRAADCSRTPAPPPGLLAPYAILLGGRVIPWSELVADWSEAFVFPGLSCVSMRSILRASTTSPSARNLHNRRSRAFFCLSGVPYGCTFSRRKTASRGNPRTPHPPCRSLASAMHDFHARYTRCGESLGGFVITPNGRVLTLTCRNRDDCGSCSARLARLLQCCRT